MVTAEKITVIPPQGGSRYCSIATTFAIIATQSLLSKLFRPVITIILILKVVNIHITWFKFTYFEYQYSYLVIKEKYTIFCSAKIFS